MKQSSQSKKFMAIAAVFAMLATVSSAFVAHLLKDSFNAYQLAIFQTGVFYQFIHSLGLLGVGLVYFHLPHRYIKLSGNLFIIGIILFSGSLYLISMLQMKSLGIMTPIGGLAFVLGWLCLAIGVYQHDVTELDNSNQS